MIDPPSSVLFISLLFSLIGEMLISVSPKLASMFTRSSSLALKRSQTLNLHYNYSYITNCIVAKKNLTSIFCFLSSVESLFFLSDILFSIVFFFATLNLVVPTKTRIGLTNNLFLNFIFIGIFWP